MLKAKIIGTLRENYTLEEIKYSLSSLAYFTLDGNKHIKYRFLLLSFFIPKAKGREG